MAGNGQGRAAMQAAVGAAVAALVGCAMPPAGHAPGGAGLAVASEAAAPCALPGGGLGAALDGAALTSTVAVAAGDFTPPGSDGPLTGLPAFCRVTGVATPTPDSAIGFEVWVPQGAAWNGKLVATGNGGYNPALSHADMAYALRQGYAAVGGDTGHPAAESSSLVWGVGHPEKIVDWGTRSVHATLGPARQIIARLAGRPASRSYFYGCSTGGHQAYAEAQKYPRDFDGLIAGAPANNWIALSTESLWRYRANRSGAPGHELVLSVEKARWLGTAAVAACDGLDGVVDGVIDDPRRCRPPRFDVRRLACTGVDTPTCLTAPELAAVERLYRGATNPRTGATIYPGPVPGTEAGWSNYWRDNAPARLGFWGRWVAGDPAWDAWRFDFDHDVDAARDRLGAWVDHVDADLSAFKAASGKLITYQGWADPVISALDTIAYRDRVEAAQGSRAEVDAFFRLFVVPGMGHCGGGPGANVFGNAGTAAPIVTPQTDLLMALDRWVEGGAAPDRLTASEVKDGATVSTRALCAYPTRAVYAGAGRIDAAESFTCR